MKKICAVFWRTRIGYFSNWQVIVSTFYLKYGFVA